MSKENETVLRNLSINKIPGPDGFSRELCQIFREKLKPRLLKYFQKFKEEGTLSTHLMRRYSRQG